MQAVPGAAPPGVVPPYGYAPNSLPARPSGGNLTAPLGLPQRPTQGDAFHAPVPGAGDDIDNMIRMAEAGIKPPQAADDGDKKKKDKKARMFYDDAEISPEERMAALPRYLFTPEIAA